MLNYYLVKEVISFHLRHEMKKIDILIYSTIVSLCCQLKKKKYISPGLAMLTLNLLNINSSKCMSQLGLFLPGKFGQAICDQSLPNQAIKKNTIFFSIPGLHIKL